MKLFSFEEYQNLESKYNFTGVYQDSFGKKHYFYLGAELSKKDYRKINLEAIKLHEHLFDLANTKEDAEEANWELVKQLEQMYDKPERHYHNLEHYRYVLGLFESIKNKLLYPVSVDIALSFHDAIYDPKEAPGVNETRSAYFMLESLSGIIEPQTLMFAEKIILATAHSCGKEQLDVDSDTAYALDCDLAILGDSPDKYLEYEQAIRKEYSFCDFETYRQGRIEFLENLLSRPKIFYTELFQSTREKQARRNIENEIIKLKFRQLGLFPDLDTPSASA